MANLPDTTTEKGQKEASLKLALARGWEYRSGIFGGWFENGVRVSTDHKCDLNLFSTTHMALAWTFLNWANNQKFNGDKTLDQNMWWHNFCADLRLLPPAESQWMWMAEILRLADESGMLVEVSNNAAATLPVSVFPEPMLGLCLICGGKAEPGKDICYDCINKGGEVHVGNGGITIQYPDRPSVITGICHLCQQYVYSDRTHRCLGVTGTRV